MIQRIIFPFLEGYLTVAGTCLAIVLCLSGIYALFTWDVMAVINEFKNPVALVIVKLINAASVIVGLFYVWVTNVLREL
jgi:hypothetical protein